MTARSLVLPATAMVAAVLLTACAPTDDGPDDASSSTASEAASSSSSSEAATAKSPGSDGEYVEASADGPAQNVPKPEKPTLADEESYEGAQAFLDYLADTRAYAWQTGDTSLVREITAEECESCTEEYNDIEEVYDSGGWASSGQETIRIIDEDMPVDSFGYPAPRTEVDYSGLTIWESDGSVAHEFAPISGDSEPIYVHMEYSAGMWILIQPTPVAI
ncbi:DUF6318 family protein [Kocuria palustris]|uniref:DUF6318 family protein n=1 Tax=Kocuria palustris TaxID=71999 RepID=UPI0021A352F9|nr:DUF6318 family protein [Kocuria palustris]MCT1834141.1 DUF6318 family protein [Kocuria palustris]